MKKKLVLSFLISSLLASGADAQVKKVEITQEHKDRAAALIAKMDLRQKLQVISGKSDEKSVDNNINVLHGVPELGIPTLKMADGPQGINNKVERDYASTFYPCGVSLAATFDRSIALGVGDGIGLDARARGVSFFLGPGMNMYRAALAGRNFEYYGEDPYLAGEIAANYILGVQSHGVIATAKHFAVNNQEWDRFVLTSNVDERTLHEIYFPAFRKSVEDAGAGMVMTACGRLNATHCAENPYLLRQTLRDDWGFEGATICDWQTVYSTLNGIQAGLDIEMPNPFTHNYDRVKRLIDNGVISEADIDEKCQHVLQTIIAFGILDRPLEDETLPDDNPLCHQKAYDAAVAGPVMIKNEGILPIRKSGKNNILLTGFYADRVIAGGGSGWVHPFDHAYVTIRQGLEKLGKGYSVTYAKEPTDEQIRSASHVIISVGLGRRVEGENRDHEFGLPEEQEEEVRRMVGLSDKVIVLVHSGCEVDMRGWGDKAAAIIYGWYGGEHTGTVMAEILSGKVSPSGRLPFTFWGSFENNPVSDTYYADKFIKYMNRPRFEQCPHVDFKEGVFMGYRGIEKFNRVPLYPFGYGLTYSSFEYSDLVVSEAGDGFDVTFIVKNTGKVNASEVAQVYVAPVAPSLPRPVRELKQFDRVDLDKGEAETVTLHLPRSAFEHFDVKSHSWVADKGEYIIQVGDNQQHIILEQKVVLK